MRASCASFIARCTDTPPLPQARAPLPARAAGASARERGQRLRVSRPRFPTARGSVNTGRTLGTEIDVIIPGISGPENLESIV